MRSDSCAAELQSPPSPSSLSPPVSITSFPLAFSVTPRVSSTLHAHSPRLYYSPYPAHSEAALDLASAAASAAVEGARDNADRACVVQRDEIFAASPAAEPVAAEAALTSPHALAPLPLLALDVCPSSPHAAHGGSSSGSSSVSSSAILVSAVVKCLLDDLIAQIATNAAPAHPPAAASCETSLPDNLHPTQSFRTFSAEQQMLLTAFVTSQTDPLLKSHLEDINQEAVPVMKKLDGAGGWEDGYMAARSGSLIYGSSYQGVKSLADSMLQPSTHGAVSGCDHLRIDLAGCCVRKCSAETDKAHYAFELVSSEVGGTCAELLRA